MPLTPEEIEAVSEITGETFARANALTASLVPAQESATISDIADWNAVRGKFTRISGGSDGLDLDPEREREAIRSRVRIRLGLGGQAVGEPTRRQMVGTVSVPTRPVW